MQTYLLRRALYTIPTLVTITVIVFLLIRVLPGDVLVAMYGAEAFEKIPDDRREYLMAELGLSDPLYVQYFRWMKDIFTGRLGESLFRGVTIAEIILRRGPITAEIAIFATVISWVVGFPVGALSALKRNSGIDYFSRFVTILFLAVPAFWLGLLLLLAMVLWAGWSPPLRTTQIWQDPWLNIQIVWAPSLVLGLGISAIIARMTRSTILEVIAQDYIRTARAKGLAQRTILFRHAARNAILPVLTISGVVFGFLLGGSAVVEQVFSVKGLGNSLITAIKDQDVSVLQNLFLMYGVIFTLVNFLMDILYAWLDPRIKYS
jgi:peptide/nickel transport system permease protein